MSSQFFQEIQRVTDSIRRDQISYAQTLVPAILEALHTRISSAARCGSSQVALTGSAFSGLYSGGAKDPRVNDFVRDMVGAELVKEGFTVDSNFMCKDGFMVSW